VRKSAYLAGKDCGSLHHESRATTIYIGSAPSCNFDPVEKRINQASGYPEMPQIVSALNEYEPNGKAFPPMINKNNDIGADT